MPLAARPERRARDDREPVVVGEIYCNLLAACEKTLDIRRAEEWLRVIELTIAEAGGRVPIVAGATSNATADAVEKAQTVAAIRGVDAILTASPYYNKPMPSGLLEHFSAAAAVRFAVRVWSR